jgi:hypothetical protein
LTVFGFFGKIRADKTIIAPNTKMNDPNPTFADRIAIHPIPIVIANIPEIQANLRLSRPNAPIINEMGAPTIVRSPSIVVTAELDTKSLASDKLTVPK